MTTPNPGAALAEAVARLLEDLPLERDVPPKLRQNINRIDMALATPIQEPTP